MLAGPRRFLMAGLLVLLTAGCQLEPEESDFPRDPLLAPSLQAPPDESTYHYDATGAPPTLELVWRHGEPTARVPNPHRADRFIICVYDQQRGRCESGLRAGVPRPIWLDVAADDPAIARDPIRLRRLPFASGPEVSLGYEFRASLQLRPEYRSRSLAWQVGACLGGSCRISDPRTLRVDSVVQLKNRQDPPPLEP